MSDFIKEINSIVETLENRQSQRPKEKRSILEDENYNISLQNFVDSVRAYIKEEAQGGNYKTGENSKFIDGCCYELSGARWKVSYPTARMSSYSNKYFGCHIKSSLFHAVYTLYWTRLAKHFAHTVNERLKADNIVVCPCIIYSYGRKRNRIVFDNGFKIREIAHHLHHCGAFYFRFTF